MNLKGIKAKSDFYEFADIWYQRSFKLLDIWQGQDIPLKRRLKAYILWQKMYKRVMYLFQIGHKLNQHIPLKRLKKGGYVSCKLK